MEAYRRYRKCLFGYERTLLRLVGHDLFAENFKLGPYAYSLYGLLVFFLFTSAYTMIYYDAYIILQNMMFLCLAVQVSGIVKSMVTILIHSHMRFTIETDDC